MRKARRWTSGLLAAAGAAAGLMLAPAAFALEEQAGEADAIKACERRLCTLLQQKDARGDDLTCALTKTWARSTIKEADQASVQWGFGDARCTVHINISRAVIAAALTSGDKTHKFWVPPHTANCVVEEGGVARPLVATLSPKIVFRDGKAEKIWINLKSVEGPSSIKGTLWAAAELTDKTGLFHRPMVKAVNRFIQKHCPAKYPLPQAAAKKGG